MNIYVNYEHNSDRAGDEELIRFEEELRRQYSDDLSALASDMKCLSDTGECARYDLATDAAERFAFANWSRQPESVTFTVEVS